MNRQQPRCGILVTVTVAGREYTADSYPLEGSVTLRSVEPDNPDAELFRWDNATGGWLAVVPLARCDRVAEVTTVADFRGHTCQVLWIGADANAGLFCVGGDATVLLRDGFAQVDAGTWAKTVAVDELVRYREQHRDLLFTEWSGSARVGREDEPIGKNRPEMSALRRILEPAAEYERSGQDG